MNSAGAGASASNEASANPLAAAPTDTLTKITWSTVGSPPRSAAPKLCTRSSMASSTSSPASAATPGRSTRSDVYDPATDKWTRIADMPRRLTHAGVATSKAATSTSPAATSAPAPAISSSSAPKKSGATTSTPTRTPPCPHLPAKLAGGGLVAVGRKLHYFGGNNSARQDVAVHYVLNLDNLAAGWIAPKSMLTARSHMGYVNFAGKIYAIGGQKGNDAALVAADASSRSTTPRPTRGRRKHIDAQRRSTTSPARRS